MTERTTSCDHERLRLLLANELSPEIEPETTDHLAACPSCRKQLESLAGNQDWWTELQTCFGENTGSIAAKPVSTASQEFHISDPDRDDVTFAADFAVDFLEPCGRPETLGRIGDIEIQEVIGRGGMGIVMKGYQRELGRYVAVKVMAPHLAANGSARKRFAREGRAAAAIVHPHVMAIHSVNASSRLPYLVMPFVDCESLQQRLDRDGPLELKEILRIGCQVAAGLAAAHAQGLVHRDVKPANILLGRGVDRVMLTDFGLARAVDDASLTRTGAIAGTPQFMSPGQARGEPIDASSDLFSLGSVMYVMCTGHPPFRAETSFGVLRRISDVEPRSIREINPDLPDWLEAITRRLHAKSPDERFPSAAEFAELLETCLSHVQQPTNVPLPESLKSIATGLPSVRHRTNPAIWIGLVGAACLGVAAVLFGVLGSPGQTNEGANEEEIEQLLALKIIRVDQNSARSVMKRLDRDRNDQLDIKEQRGLKWTNPDKSKFDLDKNRNLTLTEIAIWYSNRRDLAGVTELDINSARKQILRRDPNRDFRLSQEGCNRQPAGQQARLVGV